VATALKLEQAACDWTKGECIQLVLFTRWDEIIIHRLRIGHTYLTRGHLLRGETPPRCLVCQVELTVEHIILLHSAFFINVREDFFCVTLTIMLELFSKVASCLIIDFSKILDFIVNYKYMFYLNFYYFHSSFYHLHIICAYPIYQHLHCSYMVSNRFLTTCLIQIVFNISYMSYMILTLLVT